MSTPKLHYNQNAKNIPISCGADRFAGHHPEGVFRAIAINTFLWHPSQVITVGFIDADINWQTAIFNIASEWSQYGNIKLSLVPANQAMIRVSILNTGHWSQIGTSCLQSSYPEPTLNIQSNAIVDYRDLRRVTLHEFGHAFGLAHEHQFPHGIKWNIPRVVAYYAQTQGWSRSMVMENVVNSFTDDGSLTHTSKIDFKSIMMYPIAPGLATDYDKKPVSADWNYDLTDKDKSFFKALYPFK